MSINACRRISMNIIKHLYILLDQLSSIGTHEFRGILFNINEYEWISMNINEYQLISMDIKEHQWISLNITACH